MFCGPARAMDIGPPAPPPSLHAAHARDVMASLRTQAPDVVVPRMMPDLGEDETIDRVSGEERGPRIPEPMVFDLVRPLGAKRGEGEVNVLGIIPLARRSRPIDDAADPFGLLRRRRDTQAIEWAPEIEYVLHDDLAIELELPMADGHVESYKAAGQATFGTALKHRYIHGTQVIVQYDRDPQLWAATWLYLAGFRFDETWSVFGMFGPRMEIGGRLPDRRTELLSNVSVFADVTGRIVAGVETNFGYAAGGHASLLLMPQIHYEAGRRWMIQAGMGVRFTDDFVIPEAGFRLIWEF